MEGILSKPRTLAAAALLGLAAIAPARAADLDLTAGVLAYRDLAPVAVANLLGISLSGGTYTIDDPAEGTIVLSTNAVSEGCAVFDSNTVTCPAAAVASFLIEPRSGNDTIVLSSATHPAVVIGGDGSDTFVGGLGADTYVWNPGDDNDVVDGGAGDDTLVFNGAIVAEVFTIAADGAGFDLFRNIASVQMEVENTEELQLNTGGGADNVATTPLLNTVQVITDADDAQADVLTLDAAGLCPFPQAGVFEVVGREPVQFSGFASVLTANVVCGAILDLAGGTLSYASLPVVVANALDVSLAGDTYTIHDAGEIVSPTPNAVAQGCALVDANTVTCEAADITLFNIATRYGDDTIDLTGIAAPALVSGGVGTDTIIGGSEEDAFLWNPGDGNDTVDGGPGSDTLLFNGSNGSEIITIMADGAGFDLTRNLGNIQMEVENTEVLELATFGGTDEVKTTNLLNTVQHIGTTIGDPSPDTLIVDAHWLCPTRQGDTIEVEGRQPIDFTNFAQVFLNNALCRVDPCVDAIPSQGCTVNGVRDQPCEGTSGDDIIVGTGAADVIRGGGGRDRIRGGSGNDLICGEEGDDLLLGAAGDDTLAGGPGNDRIRGNSDSDILLGDDDADDLSGGSGLDDLDGGMGDDRLRGGGDLDLLQGGLGADSLNGGGSNDDHCADADQAGPFARCEFDF
jgi:Ca2+-binding RTX toxin-like protein